MDLNFKIDKKNILIFLVLVCNLFSFIYGSYYGVALSLILCCSEFFKNYLILLIFLCFSPFLLLNGFDNFKYYILMIISIVLYSSKFSHKIYDVLRIFSILFLPLLAILPFLKQRYGDTASVISLNDRLWPIILTEQGLNPNVIAIVASISSIGFLVNKKYFLFLIPFFILILTQSRASILFLLIFCTLNYVNSLKNIAFLIFSFFFAFFLISNTPLMDRFNNLEENGRYDRLLVYYSMIEKSFPFGFSFLEYDQLQRTYGGLDNMYLLAYIFFGIFAFFIFFVFLILFLKNKSDDTKKLRLSLFISFLIYGFFESSFIGNFFLWIIFSMCFNSIGCSKIENILSSGRKI